MAYSVIQATGTGSPQIVGVPPYILKEHITVYVNGIPSETYQWVNEQAISLVAPVNQLIKVVRRTSPAVRLTDYKDGTPLPGDTLDIDSKQAFFMAQEALDLAALGGTVSNGAPGAGGVELVTSDLLGLLMGQLTLSQFALSLRDVIGLIDGPASQPGTVAYQVAQEAHERSQALLAEANARAGDLVAEALARQAALQGEQQARIAAIMQEQEARVTADEALARDTSVLATRVDDAQASIVAESEARATALEAVASQMLVIQTSVDGATAGLTAETQARTTADNAIATSVEDLHTTLENADAALSARITNEASVRSSADAAQGARLTTLEAKVDVPAGKTVVAVVQDEAAIRATADQANATAIQTVQSSVTTTQQNLATVQTQANTTATALGTVQANYTIKTQATSGGKQALAGIGLNSTATGSTAQSEIIFMADKMQWIPSTDLGAVPLPFMQVGQVNGVNTFILPPSLIGDQMVGSRMLVDGSVTARTMSLIGGITASLFPDPGLRDQTAWSPSFWGPGAEYVTGLTDGYLSPNAWRATGTGKSVNGTTRCPVVAGRRYRVSCRVRSVGANGGFYLRVLEGPAGMAHASWWWSHANTVEHVFPGSQWTYYSFEYVARPEAPNITPCLILNWDGTAGYMEAQDVRIEELVDSSLVVVGGISADRIDTRGLSIKDASGNIILAAGSALPIGYAAPGTVNADLVPSINSAATTATWSGVSGAGRPADGATVGATFGVNISGQITPGNASTYIADAAIGNAQIGGNIWSSNYSAGSAGWILRRDGYLECNDIYARGNIRATSVTAGSINTDGLAAGAVTGTAGVTSTGSGTVTATPADTLSLTVDTGASYVSGTSRVIGTGSIYATAIAPSGSYTASTLIEVLRGGVVIRSMTISATSTATASSREGQHFPLSFNDDPGVGTHTYTVRVTRAGPPATSALWRDPTLTLLVTRR